ncbi:MULTISPECIES: bifunctional 2-polyprenyl-6-hydroxyphenol methylase/3-demethylubiquinol 3-O-methyltransferase UbiG [unclassified Ectothiorhodospira]|uniref:class I SAM-dependent methyltransferase n=1 Tax=unclassified Ectothiorhodospira TaxID=2684909 RepID=UPI001EE7DAF8|nr:MULTISPECIES: class I SAM-dependent methyltransferase [unclassified Ectothiorhodospira]MCG5515024.1 class I SAM-dependent methyltransferase [Ectothiorhodospira sp. 9100]MCG5517653.1 class I SAM-dependent methyltransferase [Ectothiorhodospira sp. 9905]
MTEALNANTGNHFTQYTRSFAEYWDDLVGWEARLAREGAFYNRHLHAHGAKQVIDIATGTGVNAVSLAQYGFEVTAVDGSENMLAKAQENAKSYGVSFAEAKAVDWLSLDESLGTERFDAAVCLGNSFTHLFDHEDRRTALRAIFRILRPGGMLIIDQRNYDAMLDQGYSSKHAFCYTGNNVDVGPVELHRSLAKFNYVFSDGARFELNMYPLRQDYLTHLLEDAGFVNVERYGDMRRPYDINEVDFVQQIAFRP